VLDATLNPPNQISLDWRLRVPPTITLQCFFLFTSSTKKTIETTGKSQLPPKDCRFQLPNQPMRKQFACILPLQKKNLSRLSSIETPPTRAMFGPKPKIQSQDFDQKIKV